MKYFLKLSSEQLYREIAWDAIVLGGNKHFPGGVHYPGAHFRVQSLRSFTWVSWGYLPGSDISFRPHFRRFLPSFLCYYLFSKCNIHFFILVFSDPTLFSLSFPVFYFPCLSLHILYFLFLSFLSVFYFLSCCLSCYLSPLTFFVYRLIFLSASVSFFVFYFSSLLSSTFILCLPSIIFPLLFFLSFCALVCVFRCY